MLTTIFIVRSSAVMKWSTVARKWAYLSDQYSDKYLTLKYAKYAKYVKDAKGAKGAKGARGVKDAKDAM